MLKMRLLLVMLLLILALPVSPSTVVKATTPPDPCKTYQDQIVEAVNAKKPDLSFEWSNYDDCRFNHPVHHAPPPVPTTHQEGNMVFTDWKLIPTVTDLMNKNVSPAIVAMSVNGNTIAFASVDTYYDEWTYYRDVFTTQLDGAQAIYVFAKNQIYYVVVIFKSNKTTLYMYHLESSGYAYSNDAYPLTFKDTTKVTVTDQGCVSGPQADVNATIVYCPQVSQDHTIKYIH